MWLALECPRGSGPARLALYQLVTSAQRSASSEAVSNFLNCDSLSPSCDSFRNTCLGPVTVLEPSGPKPAVWQAASSKTDPTQQQDWILKWLLGVRAHPLTACAVAMLCCSQTALETEPKTHKHE